MEKYVIDILKGLKPEKTVPKKFRNEKDFLFVRGKTNKILVLNHTAREIYGACDGSSAGKIIGAMRSKYSCVGAEKISIDVLRCLRDLEQMGLVELR